MRKLALSICVAILLSAVQPLHAFNEAEAMANARRVGGYKMAVISAAVLSAFEFTLSGIWMGANAGLGSEVANVNANLKGQAETVFGVSIGIFSVAGVAMLTSWFLMILTQHDGWFAEMHHNHCRGVVGFSEYFIPFLYLVMGGLQTWAGLEISNLKKALAPQTTPKLSGITTNMFWVTTGFLASGFVASVFVPVFGGLLTKHHSLGRAESGLGR